MSVLEKLTEGIVNRDLQKEGDALLSKWEATGLLEGLDSDNQKNGMAVLLENQAKELLREASSMAAGDVEGFAAVAFPIVRRVFGGLIANQLVSVQPMSLPSGLIFFLDFTYTDNKSGLDRGESLYGGGVVASQVTGGADNITETGGGLYNLQTGYASPTASHTSDLTESGDLANVLIADLTDAQKKLIRFDPDLLADTTANLRVTQFTIDSFPTGLNRDEIISLAENGNGLVRTDTQAAIATANIVRRLTSIDGNTITLTVTDTANPTLVDGLSGSYNRCLLYTSPSPRD